MADTSPPLSNAPDGHAVVAFCDTCRHSHEFHRDKLMTRYGDLTGDQLRRRLTCSKCGHRGAQVRLVWMGWQPTLATT